MFIDFLLKVFTEHQNEPAIVWKDQFYSYQWLLERIIHWREVVQTENVTAGRCVILAADYSPNAIALFLVLIDEGCIVVPLTTSTQREELIDIAQGEVLIQIDDHDHVDITRLNRTAAHKLYQTLRAVGHPGLVLFSSGSTGKSKATLHDMSRLLKKYQVKRHNLRTLTFLIFDHIGGVDTLFYCLSNGSCLVTVDDRSPDAVCRLVEKYGVEVLPVSPTFLNFLILSESYLRYDLSSLKYITYGAEVMSEMVLKKCAEIFPDVVFLQKYGTTEVGTLRSKSKDSDSLWVKIGGEGFATRVVDGILQIKAESAMMGYLNAPSPFTEDGWFDTGDMVEVDGEYFRILGRESEIINVGGEKVYPAEVESVIQEMDNVEDVTIYGEKNPITGNIVCAKVSLIEVEDRKVFTTRLKTYCRERLQNYKVPVKVKLIEERQYSERFKKNRNFLKGE